jgi:phenylacetate-CoA ligase
VLDHVDGNDRMTVEFEPDPKLGEESWPVLARAIGDRIHKALHVRLDITTMPPGTLPRYDLKTRRIIDKRPKELRRALER